VAINILFQHKEYRNYITHVKTFRAKKLSGRGNNLKCVIQKYTRTHLNELSDLKKMQHLALADKAIGTLYVSLFFTITGIDF
jgi:hypothetical protein